MTKDPLSVLNEFQKKHQIQEKSRSKDYWIIVHEEGHPTLSMGDPNRMIKPRKYIKNISLEEISKYIIRMHKPFWTHPDLTEGMSDKESGQIPFEEKKWGVNTNVEIMQVKPRTHLEEPLEVEESVESRNQEIIRLSEQNVSNYRIGKMYSITRERVRQILKRGY